MEKEELKRFADSIKKEIAELTLKVDSYRKGKQNEGVNANYDKQLDLRCLMILNRLGQLYAEVDDAVEELRINGDILFCNKELESIYTLVNDFKEKYTCDGNSEKIANIGDESVADLF